MKLKVKPLVVSLSLLSVLSLPTYAAEVSSETSTVKTVSARPVLYQNHVRYRHPLKHAVISLAKSQSQTPSGAAAGAVIEKPSANIDLNSLDFDVPGRSYVSSGPYLGSSLVFSGMNLIINTPSINQEVALLKMRQSVNARLKAKNLTEDDHPHLLLSGVVEGQANYQKPGSSASSSDIDVSSVGLDGYVLGPNHWTSALFTLDYDNDIGPNSGSINNHSRTQNSRIKVGQAFLVIGDFDRSPIYGTIGQMYVPFGTYSSNMISSSFTQVLGKTKARAALLGYQGQGKETFYGSTYIFKGDTQVGTTSRVNNGGINLGYRFTHNDYSGDIGFGVIGNIADSKGLQNTGNRPFFAGFGDHNENLHHRVPAYDLRALVSVSGHIDVLAEYITAANAFDKKDMSYHSHGAKPQALNVEAAYTFSAYNKPSSVAIGYGKSKDALAIGVPLQRYALALNTSLWKDTLQGLEFRHDVNYAASAHASGAGVPAMSASGQKDNAVTAQFDIYF
jgi:hypothetical protein